MNESFILFSVLCFLFFIGLVVGMIKWSFALKGIRINGRVPFAHEAWPIVPSKIRIWITFNFFGFLITAILLGIFKS
jgi:hypothetical protein